jgi:hypothetical protein
MAQNLGSNVWKESVNEADFFKRPDTESPATLPMKQTPSSLESGTPNPGVEKPVLQQPPLSVPTENGTVSKFPQTPVYPQPQV